MRETVRCKQSTLASEGVMPKQLSLFPEWQPPVPDDPAQTTPPAAAAEAISVDGLWGAFAHYGVGGSGKRPGGRPKRGLVLGTD